MPKALALGSCYQSSKVSERRPGQGVLLRSEPTRELNCWYDSDWAARPNTRRSVTGYMIKFGNSLILWKSKKQQTISRSSAEAEYKSMASGMKEIIWLLGLLQELGVPILQPVTVLSANKAALQIAANPIFHERTKHIEIESLFSRDKIKDRIIKKVRRY